MRSIIIIVSIFLVLSIVAVTVKVISDPEVTHNYDVPKGEATCGKVDGYYYIKITSMAPAIGSHYSECKLVDPRETELFRMRTEKTFGINLLHTDDSGYPISNISWRDRNQDGKVTAGDFFLIRSADNKDIIDEKGDIVPGPGVDGHRFILIWEFGNKRALSIELSSNAIDDRFYHLDPRTEIHNNLEHEVLNFSVKRSFLSRDSSFEGQPISIAPTLINIGNATLKNIELSIHVSEKNLYDHEITDEYFIDTVSISDIPANGSHTAHIEHRSKSCYSEIRVIVRSPDINGTLIGIDRVSVKVRSYIV